MAPKLNLPEGFELEPNQFNVPDGFELEPTNFGSSGIGDLRRAEAREMPRMSGPRVEPPAGSILRTPAGGAFNFPPGQGPPAYAEPQGPPELVEAQGPIQYVPPTTAYTAAQRLRQMGPPPAPSRVALPPSARYGRFAPQEISNVAPEILPALAEALPAAINQGIVHPLEQAGQIVGQPLNAINQALGLPPAVQAGQPLVPARGITELLQAAREHIAPGMLEQALGPGAVALGDALSRGAAGAVESFTTPGMAAMGSAQGAQLLGQAPAVLRGLMSAGFSLDMIRGAYQQIPAFKAAIDADNWPQALELATNIVSSGYFGVKAGQHAVGEAGQAVVSAPGDIAGAIRQAAGSMRDAAQKMEDALSFSGLGPAVGEGLQAGMAAPPPTELGKRRAALTGRNTPVSPVFGPPEPPGRTFYGTPEGLVEGEEGRGNVPPEAQRRIYAPAEGPAKVGIAGRQPAPEEFQPGQVVSVGGQEFTIDQPAMVTPQPAAVESPGGRQPVREAPALPPNVEGAPGQAVAGGAPEAPQAPRNLGPEPERPAPAAPGPPPLPPRVARPKPAVPELKPREAVRGAGSEVLTERGERHKVRWAVVPLERLVASHTPEGAENPAYPAELQPRDRSRVASRQQIDTMARNLAPELLQESPKASDGAPIIGPDGVVESGNGRVAAIARAYQLDTARAYKRAVRDAAGRLGIDVNDRNFPRVPVLVRIRSGGDRAEFARQANESSIAAMSSTEQALADSKRMGPELLSLMAPDDIEAPGNRHFVRAFLGQVVGPTEVGRYVDSEGRLSQDGIKRMQNAVLAKAYGDPAALEKMVESTDSNVKNLAKGLLQAAPAYAKMEQGIASGELHPLGIGKELGEALVKLSGLRREGTPVEDYLNQTTMFGDAESPETKALIRALDDNSGSAKRVQLFLERYAAAVEAQGSPKQSGMFGGATARTRGELVESARQDTEAAYGKGAQGKLLEKETGHGPGRSVPPADRGFFGTAPRETGQAGRAPAPGGGRGVPPGRSEEPRDRGVEPGPGRRFQSSIDKLDEDEWSWSVDEYDATKHGGPGQPYWRPARDGVESSRAEAIAAVRRAKAELGVPPGEARPRSFASEEPRTAYHGSPHEFDRFDVGRVGTGQGAQSYGHGLYFAENRAVAEDYKRQLGRVRFSVNDVPVPEVGGDGNSPRFLLDDIKSYLANLGGRTRGAGDFVDSLREDVNSRIVNWLDLPEEHRRGSQGAAMNELIRYWDEHASRATPEQVKQTRAGKLYTVKIPGEPEAAYLDWGKPLSEQSPAVRAALEKAGLEGPPRVVIEENPDSGDVRALITTWFGNRHVTGSARPRANGMYDVRIGSADLFTAADRDTALRRLRGASRSYIDRNPGLAEPTGEDIYRSLREIPEDSAKLLREAGIAGIKYLDQGSRAGNNTRWIVTTPEGFARDVGTEAEARAMAEKYPGSKIVPPSATHNYVVFDDSGIKIENVEDPRDRPSFDFSPETSQRLDQLEQADIEKRLAEQERIKREADEKARQEELRKENERRDLFAGAEPHRRMEDTGKRGGQKDLFGSESPRARYEGQGDLFKDLEGLNPRSLAASRPEMQRGAGRPGESVSAPSGVRQVASRIPTEFKEKGFIDFRGQRVRNATEVAQVLQIARDPRVETNRIIYVDAQGNILHSEAFGSKHPSHAAFLAPDKPIDDAAARLMYRIRRRMERLGATGFYFTHNHPSGRAVPSQPDANIAAFLARGIGGVSPQEGGGLAGTEAPPRFGARRLHLTGGFLGAVIIDHGEYAYVTPGAARAARRSLWQIKPITNEDLHASDASLLQGKLLDNADVARLTVAHKTPENFVTLAHLAANGRIEAVEDMPKNLFLSPKEATAWIRGKRRKIGAATTVAYTTERDARGGPEKFAGARESAKELIRTGVLDDYLWAPEPTEQYGTAGAPAGTGRMVRDERTNERRPETLRDLGRAADRDAKDKLIRVQEDADRFESRPRPSPSPDATEDVRRELDRRPGGDRHRYGSVEEMLRALEEPKGPTRPGPIERGKDTAEAIARDVHKALSPGTLGQGARMAGGALRHRLAEVALSRARAMAASKDSIKELDQLSEKEKALFINRVETNQKQPTPELQKAHDIVKEIADSSRRDLQALGRLQNGYYEHYFPHLWKKPNEVDAKLAEFFGKRPLEGSKSYLKRRTHPTYFDGLMAGLTPKFSNPLEAMLAHRADVDRFVMQQRVTKDGLAEGWVKRVFHDYRPPAGWKKLPESFGTIFGPNEYGVNEQVDKRQWDQLKSFAESLGIKHDRKGPGMYGGVFGFTEWPGNTVTTKFATGMGTLTHEIGHQLDFRYGLWDAMHPKGAMRKTQRGNMVEDPKAVERRVTIEKELRALADLRGEPVEGPVPKGNAYVRSRHEKMANLVDAYVNHRDRMREVAPTALSALEEKIAQHPQLQPLKDIRPSLVRDARTGVVKVRGKVIAGNLYAPAEAVRLFEQYLGPGLHGRPLYDAFRSAGNSMNQFQLGFSAFHAGFTTLDAITSKAALGIEQLARGELGRGALNVARGLSPLTVFENIRRGSKAVREAMDGETTEDVRRVLEAGGRFGQDTFYDAGAIRAFQRAWRGGHYGSAAVRAPLALAESVASPILQWLVPRQKVGIFLDMANAELRRLGEDATPQQRRYALGRAWDSVDNRMGQLVYDNQFWNKTAKDLAMASVRSLGWNVGTLRELGGAAFDVATIGKRLGAGQKGELRDAAFTHRMAYAVALPLIAGFYGAIYQKLVTGEDPKELKDYFFPRTGKTNPDGSAERVALPSYMKDLAAYREQPLTTVGHKLHPIITTIGEMLQNKDFYGTEIRDPEDSIPRQTLQLAQHAAKSLLPFSVQGYQRMAEAGEPPAKRLQSFFGITPAASYVTKSAAQKEISRAAAEQAPDAPRSHEQAERHQTIRSIERMIRLDDTDSAREAASKALEDGKITESDLKTLQDRLGLTLNQVRFKPLPVEAKLRVWKVATPEERDELRPLLAKTLVNADQPNGAFAHKTQDELEQIGRKLRELAETDQELGPEIQRQLEAQ